MKIAVAGATGYVGEVLVAELTRTGHTPIALVRRGSPTVLGADRTRQAATPSAGDTAGAAKEMLSAEIALVDWADPATVKAALRGCDAVVQTIGITRAQFKFGASYETIDFGTTVSLLAAAKEQNLKRFVLLSSVGASERGVEYLRWKWKTEEIVKRSGLPWVIVRPSFIAGPGRVLNRFLDAPLAVFGVVAKATADRYRSIDRTALAHVLARAATSAEADGQILEGTSLWKWTS